MVNTLKLKSAIVEAGYTQETLSKEMNISANSLSSKINGKSQFNLDEVSKLCKILNISADSRKVAIFLA